MEEETWKEALEKAIKNEDNNKRVLITGEDMVNSFNSILTYLKLNYTLFKKEKKETG